MPITQDRLISLVQIYETNRGRQKQLINQTAAIYQSITNAYHNQDLEEMISLVQSLIREIDHCTKIREDEYQVFTREKVHFERKAKSNDIHKEAMRFMRANK